MQATRPVIWEILQARMDPSTWYHLHDLYQIVDSEIEFNDRDLEPPAEYASTDTNWQKQVRSVLKYRTGTGDLSWDEDANYRLARGDPQSPRPVERDARDRGLWAFCANPRTYDIERAVRTRRRDLWSTAGSDVRRGDLALVWRTKAGGDRRGVVAFALVLDDPEPRRDEGNPLWVEPGAGEGEEPRAWVRYILPRDCPIWEEDLPLLSDLNVARARGGTVFHVDEAEWESLVAGLQDEEVRAWLDPGYPPAGEDWSPTERELVAWDYARMLSLELDGGDYVKKHHRERLDEALASRTDGAIEWKYQNASAVLHDEGLPFIDGFKPATSYQQDYAPHVLQAYEDVVEPSLPGAGAPHDQPPPDVGEAFDSVLVDPPEAGSGGSLPPPTFRPHDADGSERETKRRSIGRRGERFVFEFEQERLRRAGRPDIAESVQWVALEKDGLGFDVRSYEAAGGELLIEVKATTGGWDRAFHITRTELARSRADPSKFRLYRVFDLDGEPRIYVLEPPLEDHCTLEPTQFLVLP